MKNKLSKVAKRMLCALVAVALLTVTFSNGVLPETGPEKVEADAYVTDVQKIVNEAATICQNLYAEDYIAIFTSIFSVNVGILQVAGIISDPTKDMLKNINNTLNSVNTSIAVLDGKINELMGEMKSLEAQGVIRDRNANARFYMKNWNELQDASNVLQSDINQFTIYQLSGIREWCSSSTHDGLYIVYTTQQNTNTNSEETVITYSKSNYAEGVPTIDYNGAPITDYMGVPASVLNGIYIAEQDFNVDTYQDIVKNQFVSAFITAADAHTLDAPQSFYNEWVGLTDVTAKTEKAQYYAEGFLKTMTYKASCKKMSEEDKSEYINRTIDHFNNYCDKLVRQYDGIDAAINAIINTHILEGEARDEIINARNIQELQTTIWMLSILGMIDMSNLITVEKRDALVTKQLNTINSLKKIVASNIRGYDNFCYVTGGLLVQKTDYQATSEMYAYIYSYMYHNDNFIDAASGSYNYSDPWKLTKDNGTKVVDENEIVNTSSASAIIQLFNKYYGASGMTWTQFMKQYGVTTSDEEVGSYLTSFDGGKEFGLHNPDTPYLKTRRYIGNSDKYFGDQSKQYQVNEGNDNDVDDNCFVVHDKVSCDFVDSKSGGITSKQDLVYRALYAQNKANWLYDEIHAFFSQDGSIWTNAYYKRDIKGRAVKVANPHVYSRKVAALESQKLPAKAPESSLEKNVDSYTAADFVNQEKQARLAAYRAYAASNNWSDAPTNSVGVNRVKDINTDTFDDEINYAVRRANNVNIQVNLTDELRNEIKDKMKEQITHLDAELQDNQTIKKLDVFGINGDAEKEKALAEAVLKGSVYLDENGNCLLPDTAMDTYIRYEAEAIPRFKKDINGKITYEIDPLINIQPMLMVWNSQINEYDSVPISDEIMKLQGLVLNAKLPACFLGKNNAVTIVHYQDVGSKMDRFDYQNISANDIIEGVIVQGSGHDAIVEFKTDHCSPFEVMPYTSYNLKAPKTSDSSNDVIYILIMMISMMSIAGVVILVAKRRRQYK